jgi:hypothetical protein
MKKNTKIFLALFALFAPILGFSLLAVGPDFDIHFSRTVPSTLDADRIDRNISSTSRWTQWFYSLSEVSVKNTDSSLPPTNFKEGSIVELKMNPRKGQHKKFQLKALVTEYTPGKKLSLRLLEDSSNRLTQIFDRLEWKIEILPPAPGAKMSKKMGSQPQASIIQGTAIAHTQHWRARLFGRLAEKILMNQVFLPNLVKLAELKQPFSVPVSQEAVGLITPESSQQ